MKTCLFFITTFLLIGLNGFANTYTVTDASDTGPNTLRDAINSANVQPGLDTVVFDATLNGANITLATSDTITDSLVIIGSGVSNTAIDGGGAPINLFVVVNNADVTFKNMTISDGARGIIAEFTNGNVTIINCEMFNFTQWEAVYFDNGAKNLFIDRCYIHDNNSGININGATDFDISNSTLSNHGQGSGVYTAWSLNGNTNIINNTFFQNSLGMYVSDPNSGYVVNIFNNTISQNSGPGIDIGELVGNVSNVNLINNISINNGGPSINIGAGGQRAFGELPFHQKNIIDTCVSSGVACPTSFYSTINPNLGVLQLNSGITPTMSIDCNSSAYNAGMDSIAILNDQRGMPRYGVTDIGAYEFQADTSSMTSVSCDSLVAPSGNYTWFITGIYTDTLMNQTGCDSVVTVNLTINKSDLIIDSVFACDVYTWINGNSYTSSGADTLTLTNIAGCDSTMILNLTINSSPIISSVTPTSVSCFAGTDGTTDITVSGGTMPYSFQWSSGQTTEDLIGVSGGNYSVTVMDSNGCSVTGSTMINEPNPIDLSITSTDATCGQNDGSATVIINSGGTAPFTYTWSSGVNTTSTDSLSAGNYTVQVVDVNGCNAAGTIGINDLNGPTITLDFITDPSCVGDNDGGINITVSGGATPYSINWSEGSATEDLSGIISGNYDVTVTDANGCEALASYLVSDPAPIDLSNVITTEASCAGADGSATITASGGDGNYNYQWSASAGSVTTPTASNLSAGVYSVFVSDGNGCTATTTIGVNNTGGPTVMEDLIIQPTCNGNTVGAISVSVFGGTSPYTYSWNTGQTTEDISGLTPGTYDLTVIDQGGCVGMYVGIVDGLMPIGEPICLVTVDTLTSTNKITWVKTDTAQISHYNIYREGNATGVYNLVGSKPVNQLSEWTDPTANPQIRAWRYKISAVDSCGNESQLSPSHKTIHLVSNLGVGGVVNLSWDYYDGFTYGSYYINRFHSTTGWEAFDTIASSFTSLTDPSPPGLDNSLQYEIIVVPPSTCTSTKAVDHNTTRSNRHTSLPEAPQTVNENEIGAVTIYPNPNNGNFIINLNGIYSDSWKYKVVDITGKIITQKDQNSNLENVNLNNVEAGIYLIEISVNNQTKVVKIVVQ